MSRNKATIGHDSMVRSTGRLFNRSAIHVRVICGRVHPETSDRPPACLTHVRRGYTRGTLKGPLNKLKGWLCASTIHPIRLQKDHVDSKPHTAEYGRVSLEIAATRLYLEGLARFVLPPIFSLTDRPDRWKR